MSGKDNENDENEDIENNPIHKEMTEKKTKEIENLTKMLKEADEAIQAVEAFAKDMERKLTYSENEKKYFQEDLTQAKKEYEILEKFTRERGASAMVTFANAQRERERLERRLEESQTLLVQQEEYFTKSAAAAAGGGVTDGGEVEQQQQKHLSILKEYQQRAINAEEQLFSATEQAENEASLHLENLKSTEREKQVLEDRLRKEEQKVASLRQELNECTSKLLLLETSSRELKDEVEDKQKVIEGLKKDIDVQDEILIQKELTIVKNEEELNEKLMKEALVAKEIVDDAVLRCTEAEEKVDLAEMKTKALEKQLEEHINNDEQWYEDRDDFVV